MEFVLFILSIYLIFCGIAFLLGKKPKISSVLYLMITKRVKDNVFYRKALGIDFIWIGAFGLTIISLVQLQGFTDFGINLVRAFFVIELLITIFLKIIYYKKIKVNA